MMRRAYPPGRERRPETTLSTMRRFAIAFAALALVAGVVGFAPVPAALAGVAKMHLFAFALLATISLTAHLSFERKPADDTAREDPKPAPRGPLDRA